ncbi:MAG: antibiotic biosynthesis monooxygenase family protein [Acidimicrobiales bacterium]
MAEEECTAIVAYEVDAYDSDKFLDSWNQANAYIQEQGGHLSTTLHQAASASPDFRFVNVTRWESADAFRAATQSDGFRQASARLDAYPIHASVYEVVPT